jgi:hypothetical protein
MKTQTEFLTEQYRLPKLCLDCRRKIKQGTKKIGSFSTNRFFCYSKQIYIDNLSPVFCNGYKKIFSENQEILIKS